MRILQSNLWQFGGSTIYIFGRMDEPLV